MKDLDWVILKVLYEKKSITKAAEALYLTQSALTKRIKAIEAEWQIEIVKRSSKGVIFTEEGRYLAQKANVMLDFLEEIKAHFHSNGISKELLKIGVPNSFARLHMPRLLSEYMIEYNRIQFKTVPNSSDIIIQQITDGSIDIAIVCGDYPYLGEKIRLFDEELYIVTPKGMALDQIEYMPLIESYLNPMVKKLVDQWWKNHFGNMPHEAHFVPYSDIAIEMVDNGLGICFLFGDRWNYNRNKLQLLPVCDKNDRHIARSVWMMISEKCFKSPDIMDFVTFVEKYYRVN